MGCGRCHRCGHRVRTVLDGEEWCDRCKSFQRPLSHGWARGVGDKSECPKEEPCTRASEEDSRGL